MTMLKSLKKIALQIAAIIVLSVTISLMFNGLRPDDLSLLHAQQSTVQLSKPGGEITLQDAALLYVSDRALFLDARSRMEYQEGHIKKALSLPTDDFGTAFRELKDKFQDREILVTYCDRESCPLSQELADSLIQAGFKNVQVLKNGWTLWNNEKLPTEISTTATNR